jgi:hypothetical protein
MIRGTLIFLAVGAALVVQEFIPPLHAMHDARVFLLPVVIFYGTLALPYPAVLGLAFAGGMAWDLTTLQFLDDRVEISAGWSIVLFGVLCSLIHGLRPLFLRGRWEVYCLSCGLGTSAVVLAEFLMITLRRGTPIFSEVLWWRVGVPGMIALLLALPVYLVFGWIERATGSNRPEGLQIP